MSWIKKTGRGYQVISKILETQTHSRLDWQEAQEIQEEWDELESEVVSENRT